MHRATITALESAVVAGSLDEWLALLPETGIRDRVRRAIEIDRRLWTTHPASLPSCLLARTFLVEPLAELHEAWSRELDGRGSPWVRPLRGLMVPDGMLAELHSDEGLDLRALRLPSFESDDVLVVVPYRFHPSTQALEDRRRDRLHWAWSHGEARIEPDPRADVPLRRELYPRVETDGWGPACLVRAPFAPREVLPCPEEGSAKGHLSVDGKRLFVYGTLDEYAGGFVMVLDPRSLRIERRLSMDRPVASVHECERADRLIVRDYDSALFLCDGDEPRRLPMTTEEVCLSPSGRYLATLDQGMRIWSLADVGGKVPRPEHGLPTRFDPSGDRLVAGRRLRDGHTGVPIANLRFKFGNYLEGGPAWPWFHVGARHLVCMHTAMQVNDTRSGKRLAVAEPRNFPQWCSLDFDRAGTLIAVIGDVESAVALYELPSGRCLRVIPMAGTSVAIQPDGHLVAARKELAVEVRTTALGELQRSFVHPTGNAAGQAYGDTSLRFSHDGRRIASFVEGDGWRIWSLEGNREENLSAREAIGDVADFAPPRHRDWTVVPGSATLFVHRPTGTRIALPAAGPWIHNPARPEIVACESMHVELRAGEPASSDRAVRS